MTSIWLSKKDGDAYCPPQKFKLFRGKLHERSTLNELHLTTLQVRDKAGDFLSVAFDNDGFSYDLFTANTKGKPLQVTGQPHACHVPLAGRDVNIELSALSAQMQQMRIERNRASQTTRNYINIAEVHLETARKGVVLPKFELSGDVQPYVQVACTGLAKSYQHGQRGAPQTLRAMSELEASLKGTTKLEECHLQVAAMKLIKALVEAAVEGTGRKRVLFPVDTHRCGLLPGPQQGMVDCSIMAATSEPLWAYVAILAEFKLKETDFPAALGQLISRALRLFEYQPRRQFFYGMAMSPDVVQIFCITKIVEAGVSVEASAMLPLTVGNPPAMCPASGTAADGLKRIAVLLAGTLDELDFKMPDEPRTIEVQGVTLGVFQELRKSHRKDKTESDVYLAMLGNQRVVVKRFCSPREMEILQMVRDAGGHQHCIQLRAELNEGVWTRQVGGQEYVTAVLVPRCEPLVQADVPLLAQVAVDMATAVSWLATHKVQHRDISPHNIGVHEGRGVLFDFSAGKVVTSEEQHSAGGAAGQVTGTPLFVAYSLLKGGNVHTESTHLESLYYSLRYCATGSLPDEWAFREFSRMGPWAHTRWGYMACPIQQRMPHVSPRGAEFLSQLHQLFWQTGDDSGRYRSNVTVKEFVCVCEGFLKDMPTTGVQAE